MKKARHWFWGKGLKERWCKHSVDAFHWRVGGSALVSYCYYSKSPQNVNNMKYKALAIRSPKIKVLTGLHCFWRLPGISYFLTLYKPGSWLLPHITLCLLLASSPLILWICLWLSWEKEKWKWPCDARSVSQAVRKDVQLWTVEEALVAGFSFPQRIRRGCLFLVFEDCLVLTFCTCQYLLYVLISFLKKFIHSFIYSDLIMCQDSKLW